jgi:DNA-directed RNA polymerase specialized sigma24 family protein
LSLLDTKRGYYPSKDAERMEESEMYPLARRAVKRAELKLTGIARCIVRTQREDCTQVAVQHVWEARSKGATAEVCVRNAATQVMRYCITEARQCSHDSLEADQPERAGRITAGSDGVQCDDGDGSEEDSAPVPLSLSTETLAKLDAMCLTQLERDAVTLTAAHGYTHGEAAARLGVSSAAVSSAVGRVRRKGMQGGVGCGC